MRKFYIMMDVMVTFEVFVSVCKKQENIRSAPLTSSSSATLDSLSAVGKTRGVNVTWMFPEGLGSGISTWFSLLFTSLFLLRSKHRNNSINIQNPSIVGIKMWSLSNKYLPSVMICLFSWLLTIFFSLFWSSSFCFSCHAVSSADVFCLSVSFILSIRSRSSFSSFPHQINHVSHLRFLAVRRLLTESQNVTFIVVSSAYLLSARFFSALDLDKDESFSWYFSRALSLISFFSSLSEVTCTSWELILC